MACRDLKFEITATIQKNEQVYSAAGSAAEQDASVQDYPSPFSRTFYDELYFSAYPTETGLVNVQLALVNAATKQTVLMACDCFEWPLPSGYAHRNALIFDLKGVDCGFLYYDVRLIAPEDIQEQQAAKEAWSEEREAYFALQFGSRMGKSLSELLPVLLPVLTGE